MAGVLFGRRSERGVGSGDGGSRAVGLLVVGRVAAGVVGLSQATVRQDVFRRTSRPRRQASDSLLDCARGRFWRCNARFLVNTWVALIG